eukprot:bmy_19746T0
MELYGNSSQKRKTSGGGRTAHYEQAMRSRGRAAVLMNEHRYLHRHSMDTSLFAHDLLRDTSRRKRRVTITDTRNSRKRAGVRAPRDPDTPATRGTEGVSVSVVFNFGQKDSWAQKIKIEYNPVEKQEKKEKTTYEINLKPWRMFLALEEESYGPCSFITLEEFCLHSESVNGQHLRQANLLKSIKVQWEKNLWNVICITVTSIQYNMSKQREQPLGYIYVLLGLAGWEQNTDKGTGAYGPVMAWSSGSLGALEFLEAQLAGRVTTHHGHHDATGVNAQTISLQTRRSGRDLVENVRELCSTDLHVISSQLGKDSPALPDLLTLIGLDDGVTGARGGALRVARRRLTGGAKRVNQDHGCDSRFRLAHTLAGLLTCAASQALDFGGRLLEKTLKKIKQQTPVISRKKKKGKILRVTLAYTTKRRGSLMAHETRRKPDLKNAKHMDYN